MLITFESTHQAIHYEKLIKAQFAVELIPTPREISASCGLSLLFEVEDFEAIQTLLTEEDKRHLTLYEWVKSVQGKKAVRVEWRV